MITASGTSSGPRVVAGDCPVCRRPLILDHAGHRGDDGAEYVDLVAIVVAQQLHAGQCTG